MRVHSKEKIEDIKKLRRRGYSINELVSEFGVPKTTVWHHIHDVKILPRFALILKAKRGGSAKRCAERTKKAQKRAEVLLRGPHREKVISLAMLYWAEGGKNRCDFINSDGDMIKLYIETLINVFGVSKKSIKPTLRYFTGMDREECLSYWSNVTELPKQAFTTRLNDGGTRGKTRYGMCRICLRRGSWYLKIFHALIDQIKEEYCICPRSSVD